MATADTSGPAADRAKVALQWLGIAIGCVVVVLLIAAVVLETNADALRGPIARMATSHLGRPVRLDGRLELHLLSWTPRAVIHQLRIANPAWVKSVPADMARIGRLQVSLSIPALFKGTILLPYLAIDDSDASG